MNTPNESAATPPAITALIPAAEIADAVRLAFRTLVAILNDKKAPARERRSAATTILRLAAPKPPPGASRAPQKRADPDPAPSPDAPPSNDIAVDGAPSPASDALAAIVPKRPMKGTPHRSPVPAGLQTQDDSPPRGRGTHGSDP